MAGKKKEVTELSFSDQLKESIEEVQSCKVDVREMAERLLPFMPTNTKLDSMLHEVEFTPKDSNSLMQNCINELTLLVKELRRHVDAVSSSVRL